MDYNHVYLGDCRKLLPKIKESYITITDPPYNQNYNYNEYSDNLSEENYLNLLSNIKRPAVVIHYPEQTINILPKVLGTCDEVVSWVYDSPYGKQHRLISWWGCRPNLKGIKDWWEVPIVSIVHPEKTDHPCQIPLEIMNRIIQTTTNENDLIVDPFAGSGTTLLSAKINNRKYIGFEIDKLYVDIIKKRLYL